MEIPVRRASADDIAAIAEVFRKAALSNAGDRDALVAHPEFLVWPSDAIARGETVVATTVDGRIVGFAGLRRAEVAELDDLFVDPAWTRRGIATRLVEHLREDLASTGGGSIEVTANPHAMEFYLAAGFVDRGEATTEFGAGRRMRLEVAG